MQKDNQNLLRVTEKSQVKRGRIRASYDRQLAYSIIDEALVAYIAFNVNQQPFVIPTSHWRDGDKIYWHGAASGRMTRGMVGQPVCITIALVDGLVLARSAFHHSVNYRSVMLFGQPQMVTDPEEKERQLEIFINHLIPNRWPQLRPINKTELKATGVMFMPIDEGSVKVRSAPPADDEDDYGWPVWAGVVPLATSRNEAQPCPRLDKNLSVMISDIL